MNIDMDGEPHAYGPPFEPKIKPMENLRERRLAGHRAERGQETLYEAAKKTFEELEKKKADL